MLGSEAEAMRILHTADWHLGDRLGRIDRTEDLKRAVARVADLCGREKIDVLLVAGDLFSELARPDGLRDAIRHLQDTFFAFLRDGGTILTLTGNHDNENFCQTLRHAMSLASPAAGKPGDRVPPGRLYLATDPTLLRLGDRSGTGDVQFVLMPYPTPARYLTDETTQRYQGLEEKNRHLMSAFAARLQGIKDDPSFDTALPSVLSAHVAVQGCDLSRLFRLSEQEDVLVEQATLTPGFAYVALGHIHKAQALAGQRHVRYSGSIERMDLGEEHDDKGVVVFDVGPAGLTSEPRVLPLEATPVYRIEIRSPSVELPGLREGYRDAQNALVKIEFTYTAGVDNLEETLRELEAIFPRWYDRHWTEANALDRPFAVGQPHAKSFEETVRDYLSQELMNHPDSVREAVLARAETLMREVSA
jgi:exonuclease SbcD